MINPLKLLILIYFSFYLLTSNALAAESCLHGDCYNGHGTYQWPSGNQYTGTFKDGFRNDQGIFTFTNGDKYIGEYKRGKRNGTGIYFFNDGSKYEGEYVNDVRNGFGIFTLSNGARYEGQYKDGLKHGRGKFTFPDGSAMNGNWEAGTFVEPIAALDDNASQKYSLTINPLPADATIRFVDRPLTYEPRIKLSLGRYKVEISHSRYITKVEIIDILKNDLVVPVTLKLAKNYNLSRDIKLTRGDITFNSLYNKAQQDRADQELGEINRQKINAALLENENGQQISIIDQVKQEIEVLKDSLLDPKLVSIQRLPGSTTTFDRVALVIGNSQYPLIGKLKNPEHDAKDIAAALRKLQFKVTIKLNVNQEEMETAIAEFGERIQKNSLGLFYYAGHGVQVNGNNYLIPVHSGIKKTRDIRYKAVDLNLLVDEMAYADNGKNIVILDSCRNNPLPQEKGRNSAKGLARTDAPPGTLIAYATSPGSVAIDGEGRNGIYTKYLLENIFTPGIPIEMVFKRVLQGVASDTGRKQIPWMSSSLDVDFYFASK